LSLRFILGRAGSGKTRACLDAIRDEAARRPRGPALIMLVPEQATHQTERALWCAGPPPRASLRAQVLSFRRLAARILAETGPARTPILDDLGRKMLLTAIAAQAAPELIVFGAAARRRGFAGRLARTISELNAERAGADALWEQYEALTGRPRSGSRPADEDEPGGDSTLAGKLHDLAILLVRYRERISGSYIDPEETLDLAAERLAGVPFLRGARIWIDGFAGFTPQQYGLLGAILGVSPEVSLTLCLDARVLTAPAWGEGAGAALAGLFAPTLDTYRRLLEVAEAAGTQVLDPLVLPLAGQATRFPAGGHLSFLESHWEAPVPFELSGLPQEAAEKPGPVRLVLASDQRAEVTGAAEEILRLCREGGYEWRDISVIVPDMDSYHDALRTVFRDHGIPCFLDRRRPVPYHPLVEFLRSAVEICEGDFAPEAVFRWLKTDLGPISRDDVDILENYVLRHGIRGARWLDTSPWRYAAADLELGPLAGEDGLPPASQGQASQATKGPAPPATEGPAPPAGPAPPPPPADASQQFLEKINLARDRVTAILRPLFTALRRAARRPLPAGEMLSALAALLSSAGVAETLQSWRDGDLADGLPEQAQEHEEVWRRAMRLLEQAYAALGETPLRLDQFAAVLATGLESLTLGLVPPSLDQVICGTVERSRQPDVRATFVLGAVQGALPSIPAEDLVFTDSERDGLAAGGMELAPTARERSFHLRYLGYIAMTRASEYLWVSWPVRHGEKESHGPAAVVSTLKLLFPWLEEAPSGGRGLSSPPLPPANLRLAAQRTSRALSLARQGQRLDRGWLDLYQWMLSEPGRREPVKRMMAGLGWRNEPVPLDARLARSLFGYPVRGSVSRLERFAACPFAHFAGNGLRLEPRPRRQVTAPELGTFFHAVLQAFFNRLMRSGEDLAGASDEAVERTLKDALDSITPRLQSEVLLSSCRHRYLARILGRTAGRTVWWLRQHARRSAFKTIAVETGFGLPGSRFAALELEGVSLRGVIDRIDLAESEGRRLVRIIDYKSGAAGWKLSEVVHDLKLQLLLYLAAARSMLPELFGGPVEVAGIFLFPVRDPLLKLGSPDQAAMADQLRLDKLHPDGLVLAEGRVASMMDRDAAFKGPGRLFSFRVASSGQLVGGQPVTAGQLDMLVRFAVARAEALAARIAAGDDAIYPWRRGTRRGCSYCDFHALCAFDPSLPGNRYRELPPVSAKDAWEAISAVAGEVTRR